MSKAKRLLRSVRFKYIASLKRIATLSNCIFIGMFALIAVILINAIKDEVKDFSINLDDFRSAKFVKESHLSVINEGSTPAKKQIAYTMDSYITKLSKVPKNKQIDQDSPFPKINKNPMPHIKLFYKGKPVKMKLNEVEGRTSKVTFRDIFNALAHPRLFTEVVEKSPESSDASSKVRLNDWIQVNSPKDKHKFLVYSAYWDARFDQKNFVRIMAIMVTKYPPTVYCRIQLKDLSYVELPVAMKIMNEHWRLKYASYFISCEVPKNTTPPSKVFVSLDKNFTFAAMLPVYNNKEDADVPKGDIAVCVKPFHYYYDRVTWLLEFIELHMILGVDHFFFYNHTVGPNVDALLRNYMKQKVVTVLPWNLSLRSQKEIRTEGIFSSLNDCMFRTMYVYNYVIMLDFDEYIIPRLHDNLLSMIEQIEDENKRIRGKPGSFVFRNTFFYLYWENDTSAYGAEPEKPPKWLPYFVTQYKTRRLSGSMKIGSRSKYIVVPERAVEVGNHVVWRHTSGSRSIPVPDTVAVLHHYRICEFGGFNCLKKPNAVDRTAVKFGNELLSRALQRCFKVFPELEGRCPISPPLGSPW